MVNILAEDDLEIIECNDRTNKCQMKKDSSKSNEIQIVPENLTARSRNRIAR